MFDTALSETIFAFVDVETTGLNPQVGDRVCEVAIVRCQGDVELERFDRLINPGRPISPAAAAVNGLSDRDLYLQPPFAAFLPEIQRLLFDAVLVAHNAPFDLRFLDAEFMRLGQPPLSNPCVDTLELARSCYRLPSYSLGNLAYRFGILNGHAHRALADVQTTQRLLSKLIHDLKARRLSDLTPSISAIPMDMPVPQDLERALRERRRLFLRYQASNGLTERTVDPLAVQVRDQVLYLVAYCHLRQERRTFRLDRILVMEMRDEKDD